MKITRILVLIILITLATVDAILCLTSKDILNKIDWGVLSILMLISYYGLANLIEKK